ncbi:MAG: hypothetical protein PHV39_05890 [Methanomicrobium sp.]|nr:hypothetical protein [Methanomicrobium sp.]
MSSISISDVKIPFAIALLSGVLFLASGILYSISGASTGYVLVLIAFIVVLSALRMKQGVKKDAKDAGLAVLFFGVLNLISFIFILSGASAAGPAFYFGILGSLAGIIGGIFAVIYSKEEKIAV